MEFINIMDPELEVGVVTGNLGLLMQRLADCQAFGDYSDILSRSVKNPQKMGNILHLAAWNAQNELFQEVINELWDNRLTEKLLSHQEWFGVYQGYNPLHVGASVGSLEMVQAITGYYYSKYPDGSYKDIPLERKPWVAKDSNGSTPLQIAIQRGNQGCAIEILSLDMESLCGSVDSSGNSLLFLAVREGCNEVAKEILLSTTGCMDTGEEGFTALHFAPHCSVEVFRLLIKKAVEPSQYPIHESNIPILHKWVDLKRDSLLFEQLNDEENKSFITDEMIGRYMANLISDCDHDNCNAFHISAREQNMEVSKIMADFYHIHKRDDKINDLPPWLKQNSLLVTPLELALRHHSLDASQWLKDTYGDAAFRPNEVDPMVLAVKMRKYDVATQIGETMVQYGWFPFCPDGKKFWKPERSNRTDVKIAKWLVINFSNLIPADEAGEALNYASKQDYDWLVESVLKEHPFALRDSPLAWKEACQKGHYKTILAFVENCPYFTKVCLEQHTTPLHHVKFSGYEEYLKLVENPVIKRLINFRDQERVTPLRHAMRSDNVQLGKALLGGNDMNLRFKDFHYLGKVNNGNKWRNLFIQYGILNIATISEYRNTLSVVAALIATVTFTAGFTIPGGFDQKGVAILSNKYEFSYFIFYDASALYFSLITLALLQLSVIFKNRVASTLNKIGTMSLVFALLSTTLAFTSGVSVVLCNDCDQIEGTGTQ